ncbi:InsL [Candidatus Thiomargarita nelsonii]|uniref:InsL n=1 Tax=Candidatus Thiomargarita nelsonii TaxID=1003181 RepID=A0A176S3N2_9GAMM|nr:InsL [Candidatus Thiomargarita nelsonii]
MVLLYCGLDQSLREVAGHLTLLEERITDEAIRKRLKACEPWVKALLFEMLPSINLENLPDGLRFLVFDGSSIQAPGATGTDYRLHIGIDLVTLEFTHLLVTDKHTGESLKNFPLNQGDVAVVDRGLCHANAILEKTEEGTDVIARYNHASMPLYHDDGIPLDIVNWLKPNDKATYQSCSVLAGAESASKVKGHIIAITRKRS